MTDGMFRDLGNVVPGDRRRDVPRDPVIAPIPTRAPADNVIVTPPPRPTSARAIFGNSDPVGGDSRHLDGVIGPLAELLLHKGTQSALCVGVIGGPGTGKSFCLARLARRLDALARAAVAAPQGPFVSRVHLQSIDAAALEGDPALAIAARLHNGLQRDFPDLAHEFGAASCDPHAALRDANEKLDDARRRLDAERRALDDAGTRRARLTDSVLYEATGSQIDAYARANRSKIEGRLKSFGLPGEPIRTYKDLVLGLDGGGAAGLTLRSLYAFKGQSKLIVAALLLAGLGVALGIAIRDQAAWLGDLTAAQHAGAAVGTFIQAHIEWLATAQTAAFLLAGLAIVMNVARAARFIQPILKGAKLLDSDLDERRRSLDGTYAHQTKRVDLLEAEVEKAARTVSGAERRAEGLAPLGPTAFEQNRTRSEELFATLSRLQRQSSLVVPHRIVLAIDHLDAVAPDRARTILDVLHRTLAPGIIAVAAFDPQRLAGVDGRSDALERWIDVPLRIDGISRDQNADLVREALGQATSEPSAERLDGRRSDLDAQVTEDEGSVLADLAPLAGETPRAIRRLAGLYLLTRHGETHRPLLAFMIALALGGTTRERDIVASALRGDPDARFRPTADEPRLAQALATVLDATGPVTIGEALETARRAATVSLAPTA